MKIRGSFYINFSKVITLLFLGVLPVLLLAQTWSIYDVAELSGGYNGSVAGSEFVFDASGNPHIFSYHPRLSSPQLKYTCWDGENWITEDVAPAGLGINTAPGVGIDSDGNLHVAYLMQGQYLGYAFYDGEWTIEQVDNITISSSWLRLVVDENDVTHIAYTGLNQGNLRYARKIDDEWQIESIEGAGGTVCSIVLDSEDLPWILSWLPGYTLTHWDGEAWQIDTTLPAMGESYLALDDQDRPQISYYYAGEGNYDLRFCTKNSGEWVNYIIDPGVQQNKIGWDNQIQIDDDGIMHIAYFAHNACLIKHAWGTADNWETEVLDTIDMWQPAICLNIYNNHPFITYHDNIEEQLRLATTYSGEMSTPENLTAQVLNVNDVNLFWDHNNQGGIFMNLTNYRIYNYGVMIEEIPASDTQYIITGLDEGDYSFRVTAVYGDSESEMSNTAEVSISLIPPADFTAEIEGGNVYCQWQAPEGTNVSLYRVYRDSELIIQTEEVECLDELASSGLHVYWVTALYNDAYETAPSNEVEINLVVSEDQNEVSGTMQLSNFPNPFNPQTKISFLLTKSADVKLEIYNLKGQKIRELVSEHLQASEYSLIWDGRNDRGKLMPSGIYLYSLKTGEHSVIRKMNLLK
ncbi:MAG: T9SS type A sorting domain-containing protein [Candidatus Cloacimonetes bacterium]|nr:T9SS type A sorting domain-containing protein [Candidatus Cloacimonadota bacterium]